MTDTRDRAAAVADQAAAAAVIVQGEPVRMDHRVERARYAAAPSGQAEQLADAVARHLAALPRKAGDVATLALYDGDTVVAEFEGGGGSAMDVAAFMCMRATLEGKRLSFFVVPCAPSGGALTRWRFHARPDLVSDVVDSPAQSAGAWGAGEAIRLRDAHVHQLVQHLLEQQRVQGKTLAEMSGAMSSALRETTDAVTGVLKQMARTVEQLGARVRTAEDRADDATRERDDALRVVRETERTLDDAMATAERLKDENENAPERKAIEAVAAGLREGVRLRVGGQADAPKADTVNGKDHSA